ncbi:LAME_0C03334g1_1 [Lachancea meyersii CBS 8951]|uniref:E3 ubiquitin-protein ligase n=1 Tax=Lachancea meyersii CBS 8951 TaxID=1266667 RepID=A0A1G4J0G0_9SACH|nr:LAME_0C03334g1_1 [Lachancea meyersii CBS 8951]
MTSEERSVREFLLSLPRLAKESYNDAVSYLIWQTLEQCVTQGISEVDWPSKRGVFESQNWHSGAFVSLQLPLNWRDAFFKNIDYLTDDFPNGHRGSSCSRICKPTETVFYCFNCTRNPLYEICSECFDPQQHAGHRYTSRVVVRPEGRVCHCGDTSVITTSQVDNHALLKCRQMANNLSIPLDYASHSDANLINLLEQVLDYIIDTTIYLKEQSEDRSEIVLVHDNGNIEVDEIEFTLQLNGNDCNLHVKDLATKISLVLNKPLEYGLMITDVLQRGEPSVVLLKSTDFEKLESIREALAAENIHLQIKTTSDVFKEYLIDELTNVIYSLCLNSPSLRLKLSLRNALCGIWKSGLQSTRYTPGTFSPFTPKIALLGGFVVPFEQRETFPWFKPWQFPHSKQEKHDPSILRIMHSYDQHLRDTYSRGLATRHGLLEGSRFQNLLVQGACLLPYVWKSRLSKIVSCAFTVVDDSRNCIAAQYIDIYPNLLYNTVASDSAGHKLSLMSTLSQLVFQIPQIANMIISSGFIERILQVAFTLMSFSPDDLTECPPVPLYREFKLPKDSIKNKRSVICFKDIYLAMSTNNVPELLLSSETILRCMINCFAAFNNVLPLNRETSEHVEFENFEFSSYYFYFSSILVMVDGFTRNICLLQDPETRTRIVQHFLETSVIKELELLRTSGDLTPRPHLTRKNADNMFGLQMSLESLCDTNAYVIDFEVGAAPQTFFSPMSYFFKFVTLWSQCGRYSPLSYSFHHYMKVEDIFGEKRQIVWMCESALRTLVLLAQINAGYWVRNGLPIQHQARMYTKYSMREFTYFSDIYMLQVAMSTAEPNDFFVTFLSRWGLKHWTQGTPSGDYPDIEISACMVDQCFLLLIQLFSEIRSPAMKSSIEGFEKTMQAELIHALCFKNATHSELLNTIPEHVTKHPAFDLYLHDMATYTPPTKTMDAGIYALRKEHFSSVDPYFLGYSSSKRYEAEKLIRNRAATALKCDFSQTFIPARECASKLKTTKFSRLYQISETDLFGHFLKKTLDHIKTLNHEGLLGKVAHLIHISVVNNSMGFSPFFWKDYSSPGSERPNNNSIGSVLYSFLSKDDFANEHGKIREIFRCLSRKAPHFDIKVILSEQNSSLNLDLLEEAIECNEKKDEEFEKRKQLAKAKRLKIMKRIAKQQQKFLANNQVPLDLKPSTVYYKDSLEDEWTLPEQSCVFCKMGKEDDSFVYFSFLEKNMCGQVFAERSVRAMTGLNGIDMNEIDKCIDVGPVIRTCGHGSHESCLASHMKSIRTVHNHITKNVPSAWGFSLMFCPLCSSLTNSFLPRVAQGVYQEANSLPKHAETNKAASDKLLRSCYKSAIILNRLICGEESNYLPLTEAICRVQANTIKNAEVASRLGWRLTKAEKAQNIFLTNQHLISLRLLSDMRRFLAHEKDSQPPDLASPLAALDLLNHGGFNEGLHNDKDMSSAALRSPQRPSCYGKGLLSQISIYVEKWLNQDVLAVARFFGKISFSSGEKYPSYGNSMLPVSSDACEVESFERLLKHYSTSFDFGILKKSGPEVKRALSLLRSSMTVRMRRLAALLFTEGVVKFEESEAEDYANLDSILRFCGMPSFVDMLKSLVEKTSGVLGDMVGFEIAKYGKDGSDRASRRLTLCCYDKHSLINLPDTYSELLALTGDDHIETRTKKEELAICLFCGACVRIQNAVSLHMFSIGECTNHSLYECPSKAIYGCFLLVVSNSVYLAYGHRGTFYQAPFLNQHGETDEDYRNGAPVFLDEERYLHLSQDIVLGNMIPHLVYRLTDNNSDLGGWESM